MVGKSFEYGVVEVDGRIREDKIKNCYEGQVLAVLTEGKEAVQDGS